MRDKKWIFGILALLVVVLGIWFVFANSANLAPSVAGNGTTISMLWFNVSNLSITGGNGTNFTSITINQSVTGSNSNVTNVTISNGTVYYNASGCGTNGCIFPIIINIGNFSSNSTLGVTGSNFTVRFTINSSAANNATIQANVTANSTGSDVSFPIVPFNSTTVLIDAANPAVTAVSPASNANLTGTEDVLNATVTDRSPLSAVSLNLSNGTASWSWLISATNTSASSWNATLNTTNLTDGSYNVTLIANDSNNLNSSVRILIKADNTNPSATATCSPSTVQTGATFPCSCSGTDATSGVNATSSSSTSGSITSTSNTGTFTYTCTATDFAGNSASGTATYSVTQAPSTGSVGGGGSGATPAQPEKTQSFTKITPGTASIMKDFNSEIGVKQIEITVNNEAQSVKVIVTKHDGKPAEVSVSKTGKVYQYLQIETQNLATKLNKANVQFRVEKSWASSNNVEKEKVVVSKFDETNNQWNELATDYASEDSTYYYYDVALDSFSYFAISEKALVPSEETGTDTGTTGAGGGKSLAWLWILIVVAVLALIWWMRKR